MSVDTEIRSGIPIPPRPGRPGAGFAAKLDQMEIGDSFEWAFRPNSDVMAKRGPKKFSTRWVGEHPEWAGGPKKWRIWRIE